MKNTIVGNWKMNQDLAGIEKFLSELAPILDSGACEAWIAPQFIHLPVLLSHRQRWPMHLKVGAQNASSQSEGALTGEVSPKSLVDLGADFVILGHSERREHFKESDELLNQKLKLALSLGLKVIYCVGETLEERESNSTLDVIKGQLERGLKDLTQASVPALLIAYEPVWAIGTGRTASPAQAQEVHKSMRKFLAQSFGDKASTLPLLYGGSVKPDNCAELLGQPDINGALVGGASLKAFDFAELLKIASCQA
jgi:triosephosphate isomerase (TIM)